jgi:undecaprenyl-diphosphatase
MFALFVWPFTVLLAVSRIVLGLHYPSDVIVGALIGALTAAVSFNLL